MALSHVLVKKILSDNTLTSTKKILQIKEITNAKKALDSFKKKITSTPNYSIIFDKNSMNQVKQFEQEHPEKLEEFIKNIQYECEEWLSNQYNPNQQKENPQRQTEGVRSKSTLSLRQSLIISGLTTQKTHTIIRFRELRMK